MNLLHISDIHFGPYHWAVDDDLVLERLNDFNADIVLNTGDVTSDSLPEEYRDAGSFLSKLQCPHVVSIPGNHDKYSKRSHEMFREHIYDAPLIEPRDVSLVTKRKVHISPATALLNSYFTEVNYLREISVNGERILLVCADTTLFQSDSGSVEPQILEALAEAMQSLSYDRALLLVHHSILSTDEDPLINSKRVTDFVLAQKIEAVFCGHTHELDIVQVSDVITGGSYRQFMCGSLSSVNIPRDKNMFCTYENFGPQDEIITVTRMVPVDGRLHFIDTVLGGCLGDSPAAKKLESVRFPGQSRRGSGR